MINIVCVILQYQSIFYSVTESLYKISYNFLIVDLYVCTNENYLNLKISLASDV